MTVLTRSSVAAAVLSSLLLGACGGGGSSDPVSSQEATTEPTGPDPMTPDAVPVDGVDAPANPSETLDDTTGAGAEMTEEPGDNAPETGGADTPDTANAFAGRDDCLFAVSDVAATRFCYSPRDRMLIAADTDDERVRWQFPLPGTNATNDIVNLFVAAGRLHLIARTVSDDGTRGQELSSFDFGGAFVRTVAFGPSGAGAPALRPAGEGFAVASGDAGIVVGGRYSYGDAPDGDGVFAIRLDADDGRTLAYREYGEATRSADIVVAGNTLAIVRGDQRVTIDAITLDAAGIDAPVVAPATIDAGNALAILREVVRIINAEPVVELEQRLREHAREITVALLPTALGGTGNADAMLGLAPLPEPEDDGPRRLAYACANGGTLEVGAFGGAPVYELRQESCAIDGIRYDGRFFHNGVGREGVLSELDDIEVTAPDDTSFAIDGDYRTLFDRVGIRASRTIDGVSLSIDDGDRALVIDDLAATSSTYAGALGQTNFPIVLPNGESATRRRFVHTAAASAGFTVRADWSGGNALTVVADLSLDESYESVSLPPELLPEDPDEPLLVVDASGSQRSVEVYRAGRSRPSQWGAGSIVVTATDGSSARLEPIVDDPERAAVFVDGQSAPTLVRWDDGFQVICFGNARDFPACGGAAE